MSIRPGHIIKRRYKIAWHRHSVNPFVLLTHSQDYVIYKVVTLFLQVADWAINWLQSAWRTPWEEQTFDSFINNLWGAPNDCVFFRTIFRWSKNSLEFFIAWRTIKLYRWPFQFIQNFRRQSHDYHFLKFRFLHFVPQVKLFLVGKGNLTFSVCKMRWREELENFLLVGNLHQKCLGKSYWSPKLP